MRTWTRVRPFAMSAPAALLLACASAPPPPAPQPVKPVETVVVPAAPTPTETASAAPAPPPPLVIGSKFQADPVEPLPAGAVARCGTTRMRAAEPHAIAISNTGSVFAVDEADSRWLLRDVTAGSDVTELPGGQQSVFAPDASLLVVESREHPGQLVFFSVPKGERLGEVSVPLPAKPGAKGKGFLALFGDFTRVVHLAMSPDGAALVVKTSDGSAHLINTASRKLEKTVKVPAKSRLAGVSSGGGRAVIEQMDREESSFSFLGGGKYDAVFGYVVLDLRTGATLRKVAFKRPPPDPLDKNATRMPDHAYARFRISTDGTKLFRLENGDLSTIDVATGKESQVLASVEAQDATGMFGSARARPSRGWGMEETAFEVLGGDRVLLDTRILSAKDWSVDARVGAAFDAVSANGEHQVSHTGKVFEVSPPAPASRPANDGEITSLAFLPDNRLVAVAKQATFWNTDDGTWTEPPRFEAERAVTASQKPATILLGRDTLFLNEKRQSSALAVKERPRLAALSPDGETAYLVTGGRYLGPTILRPLRLGGGADKDAQERSFAEPLLSIAVAPDGTAVAVSGEHTSGGRPSIALLSVDGLSTTAEVQVDHAGDLAFGGADRLLLSSPYHGFEVHAVPSLSAVSRLSLHACCNAAAVSPDGKLAAGSHGREILVWEIASRKLVGRVGKAHREDITALAFSPDSHHLASGSKDTTVLLWDVHKLEVPPFPAKAETKLTGAADAKRYFDAVRTRYRIKPDGTLEASGARKSPALRSVTRVSGEGGAYCAIAESKVRCWGSTRLGLLGVPEQRGAQRWRYAERDVPTTLAMKDPVDVRVGDSYACALERGGDLYCWGRFSYRQPPAAPAKVLAGVKAFDVESDRVCAVGADGIARCIDPDSSLFSALPVKDAVSVALGRHHVCVLDKSGQVHCKGENQWDQLGDDTGIDRADPVIAAGLSGATAIGADDSTTCALTDQHAVFCWGSLGSDKLGRPTPIHALDGATALRVAENGVCALVADRVDCVKPHWD